MCASLQKIRAGQIQGWPSGLGLAGFVASDAPTMQAQAPPGRCIWGWVQ